MGQTRDQRNAKRIESLIEILISEGVIDEKWRKELKAIRSNGKGREVAKRAKDGKPPRNEPSTGPPDKNQSGDR